MQYFHTLVGSPDELMYVSWHLLSASNLCFYGNKTPTYTSANLQGIDLSTLAKAGRRVRDGFGFGAGRAAWGEAIQICMHTPFCTYGKYLGEK